MPHKPNMPEVLWERLDRTGDCWVYLGRKTVDGHGQISIAGKMWTTHRLAWTLAVSPIPTGMCVCHRCDNPPCCNPAHLWLGTNRENIADRCAKGRSRAGAGDRHGMRRHPERNWLIAHPEAFSGENQAKAKLTNALVREMRAAYATGTVSQSALAKRYGIVQSAVWGIVNRKQWKHVV